ncbi:MAG: hypothetical protein ACUVV4_05680 [Candidatus Bathyarchaeia archaeon]
MKRWLTILSIAALIIIGVAYAITVCLQPELLLSGSLFVSDAGRSHGGFEYNAEWNATLNIRGSSGVLELVHNIGLGDALTKHRYDVTEFKMDDEKITMKIERETVTLILVENDEVWDHAFDDFYIASWGGDAPLEEIRGVIKPLMFQGLSEHYYVELRLR